jgi:hypothetical protein
VPIKVEITEEDLGAARATGATGDEVAEFAIHRMHRVLDRLGVPREGRTVKVTRETITIDLPPGYTLPELARGDHARAPSM